MKIICKYNTGDIFRENELPIGFFSSTIYNLEVEREYLVMGIMMSEKFIFYLVDEDGKPYWYPSKLFQVSDNKVSSSWYFKKFTEDDSIDIDAICGYFELCNQENYLGQLMERDDSAMSIYFKQKMNTE